MVGKASCEDMAQELERVRQENNELKLMLRATRAIPLSTSFNESARLIYDICKSLVGAACGYVALKDKGETLNELLFLDDGGLPCAVDPNLPMPIQGLRAEVYKSGRAVYENDFMNSQWVKLMPGGHVRLNNVMFAPLNVGNRTLGIIGLANKPEGFTDKDRAVVEVFGDIAALALEHGRTIEELTEGRKRFDLAVNATKDGLWDWDIVSNEAYLAPRWYEITGYSDTDPESSYTFESWTSLIHPDDRNRVMEALRAHFEEQTPFDVTYRHRHGTGNYQWQKSRGQAVFDASGKPVRMVGSISDVNEEMSAMEKVRESEEKFRSAFLTSPDSINLNRLEDGTYLEINDGFTNILGYTRDDVMGKTSVELNIWENPEDRKRLVDGLLSSGVVENMEARFVAKDGSIRYGLMSARVLKMNNEDVIISITRNISDRKETENELNFQALLLNQIHDHITATDLDGTIIYVNEAVCRSIGRSRGELLGSSVEIYGDDQQRGATQRAIVEATLKHGEWRGEVVNYASDGTEIIMDSRTRLIKDDRGRPISMVGISTDITAKKKAAVRLQQAQKMESIGNLAGGIAHDFNNLLFPIVGMAEMLLEDLPSGSSEYQYAGEILQAGRRGSELVKQILSFSRRHEHSLVPVRVQSVMKEVLKLSRSSIPMNIEINQHLEPGCGIVMADPTHLHQIGMNLMTNAYHAVQEAGGRIDVHVKQVTINRQLNDMALPPGDYAMLSVSDTGIGIDKYHLDKIFEPYYTTKAQGKGTGLGLSVVYGIVREHKGDVRVFSEPGRGTVFEVYLPMMNTAETDAEESVAPVVMPGTEHILLVDDEIPIERLVKQMLERLGYLVSSYSSSSDALEAFRSDPDRYDAVISDMSMPRMTGEELAAEMLRIRPDIPIIVCTGFSEKMNEAQAKSMGIRGFLLKPVIRSALAQEVRRVLDETNGSGKNTGSPNRLEN